MPRLQGYKQALEDNHIPFREELVAYTSFSFETGIRAFKEILSRNVDFTAVVACCDDVAAATLSVGYKQGLTVPHDFSVIGFDNTRISEMTVPPLTTIAQPYTKWAQLLLTCFCMKSKPALNLRAKLFLLKLWKGNQLKIKIRVIFSYLRNVYVKRLIYFRGFL
jgi:hypothetical protein